mmetsp:Transcript_44016/g.82269  ORF Transcript_44016/g.82269 Transcript_44016/m.82269 type:complete len:218 (-) Transcript_44016:31-684(-)
MAELALPASVAAGLVDKSARLAEAEVVLCRPLCGEIPSHLVCVGGAAAAAFLAVFGRRLLRCHCRVGCIVRQDLLLPTTAEVIRHWMTPLIREVWQHRMESWVVEGVEARGQVVWLGTSWHPWIDVVHRIMHVVRVVQSRRGPGIRMLIGVAHAVIVIRLGGEPRGRVARGARGPSACRVALHGSRVGLLVVRTHAEGPSTFELLQSATLIQRMLLA